jgi:hypothetical protein
MVRLFSGIVNALIAMFIVSTLDGSMAEIYLAALVGYLFGTNGVDDK